MTLTKFRTSRLFHLQGIQFGSRTQLQHKAQSMGTRFAEYSGRTSDRTFPVIVELVFHKPQNETFEPCEHMRPECELDVIPGLPHSRFSCDCNGVMGDIA